MEHGPQDRSGRGEGRMNVSAGDRSPMGDRIALVSSAPCGLLRCSSRALVGPEARSAAVDGALVSLL